MTVVEALFAGLPNTGKTTYLALLYQAIVDTKAGELVLGRYDDDRHYVNEISAVLLACAPTDHTEVADKEELNLSLQASQKDFGLRVPDRSGEVWDHALGERRWSQEMDELIRSAQGFLVFVHAHDLEMGVTIGEARAAAAALGDDSHGEAEGPSGGAPDTAQPAAKPEATTGAEEDADGEIQKASQPAVRTRQTQVSLVDLIQLLVARASATPVRLSLIVSVWDMVDPTLTPTQWLHRNCRLLEQYLRQNTRKIEVRLWGVSAQGGDFLDEKQLAVLREQDAVDRAIVRAEDGTVGHVQDPLAWALTLD